MKRKFSTHLALLTFLTLLSAPVQSENTTTGERVKIGWVYAMANAPILIAKTKGYFREQGLNVEIVKFNSGPLLKRAIAENELDLAYIGSPPVYHWHAKGLNCRILAKVNYGQASVITRKDSGLNTLADLKGKYFAVGWARTSCQPGLASGRLPG